MILIEKKLLKMNILMMDNILLIMVFFVDLHLGKFVESFDLEDNFTNIHRNIKQCDWGIIKNPSPNKNIVEAFETHKIVLLLTDKQNLCEITNNNIEKGNYPKKVGKLKKICHEHCSMTCPVIQNNKRTIIMTIHQINLL
jgi:hypothetical protein